MPWSSRVGPGSTLCEIRAGTTAQAWLMRVAGTAAVDSAMLARLFFFDRHVPFEQILPVSAFSRSLGQEGSGIPLRIAASLSRTGSWQPRHTTQWSASCCCRVLQLLEDIDTPVAYFAFHYRLESLWQEAGSLRRGFVNNFSRVFPRARLLAVGYRNESDALLRCNAPGSPGRSAHAEAFMESRH